MKKHDEFEKKKDKILAAFDLNSECTGKVAKQVAQ